MTDVLETITEEPAPEVVTPEPEPEVELKPAEPVAEPKAEEQQEQKQPGYVPIAAMLDERDKRKALEAKLAAQEPRPTVSVPDPYDDPEGYNAFQESKINQALVNQRFQTSELIAKQAHGADAVEAAAKWAEEKAKADPSFASMYMREAHPIDWIVQQHKRDGIISQLPNDISSLDELIERKIAERGLTAPMAAPAVAPALKAAEPPRSIASDASPSSNVTVDHNAEFNAIFNKR